MVVGKWHAAVGVTRGPCNAEMIGGLKGKDIVHQDSLLDLGCVSRMGRESVAEDRPRIPWRRASPDPKIHGELRSNTTASHWLRWGPD